MKFYGIDARGPLQIERVASIPADAFAYAGRILLVTSTDGVHVGNGTSFLELMSRDTDQNIVSNKEFQDSYELRFGNDNDAQIYHTGSNFVIKNTIGNTNLYTSSNFSFINSSTLETLASFASNGAVTLYYDNSAKFATSSTGITITGTLVADGLSLGDDENLTLGVDSDATISHNGSNLYIKNTTGSIYIIPTGSENGIVVAPDAAVSLYYNNSLKFATSDTGATLTGILVADGLTLGDSDNLVLGTSSDCSLTHNGSNMFITNTTGSFYIRPKTNEEGIVLAPDGAVTLYYDNSAKLATSTTGVSVTGTTSTTALTVNGRSSVGGLLPAGTVAWFAASSAPTGWLKCNGAAISRTTYADLFSSISTTFGAGDGSTTFAIPDLRGEFVRGWDDSKGIDSGRVFGSWQAGAIESHNHAIRYHDDVNAVINHASGTGLGPTFGNAGTADPLAVNASLLAAAGSTETRPRNVALLACIRY